MSVKSLYTLVKIIAIILWFIFVVTVVVLIFNHNFWSMMPIISHNHVQNWLGWDLIIAGILTLCSPILKLIAKNI